MVSSACWLIQSFNAFIVRLRTFAARGSAIGLITNVEASDCCYLWKAANNCVAAAIFDGELNDRKPRLVFSAIT